MTLESAIDISIILEWENVLLSGQARSRSVLNKLYSQMHLSSRSTELLILFDPDEIDRASLDALVLEARDHPPSESQFSVPQLRVRLEEARNHRYYELKNYGAQLAKGDLIVFIDSDVLPEDGWLHEISQPFYTNPEISVVAGHTYLAHQSLVEKAFALGWFFPLRNAVDQLDPNGTSFFANNVAYRKPVFQQYPFLEMSAGVCRGACGEQARSLVETGISIWTTTSARAQHAPPSDSSHYFVRALAHGRDNVLEEYTRGKSGLSSLKKSFQWSLRYILSTTKRMLQDRKAVRLRGYQVPAAFCIMTGFYVLAFVGSCAALGFPNYARRHWQI